MSVISVVSVSSSCASCVGFTVHWMTTQLPHFCTHSSPRASTIGCDERRTEDRQQTCRSGSWLNVAAWVVTNMQKFGRGLTRVRRHALHWLAGCYWPHQIPAVRPRLQISASHGTTVLVWSLYAGRGLTGSSESPFCWLWTAAYAYVRADKWQASDDVRSPALHHQYGTRMVQNST